MVSVLFCGCSRCMPKLASTSIGSACASIDCAAEMRFRDWTVE